MHDSIDRQAAIDTLADMHCKSDEDGYVWIIRSDAWARIDALPSAQPEIIRCKECCWARDACGGNIECFVDANVPEYHGYDWFCPHGERRTEE